jgi:hypothetical protein
VRATRRQALAGAAALGAAAVLPAAARAQSEDERAETALTVVLELEQTADVAYEAIANAGVHTDLLRAFLEQERQHIEQLEAGLDNLGAKPPIPPRRTEIPGLARATADRNAAATFAIALERRTIAAYQAAIRDALDPNLMRICAGAMGTDAQQLVVLRGLADQELVPSAFETGRR